MAVDNPEALATYLRSIKTPASSIRSYVNDQAMHPNMPQEPSPAFDKLDAAIRRSPDDVRESLTKVEGLETQYLLFKFLQAEGHDTKDFFSENRMRRDIAKAYADVNMVDGFQTGMQTFKNDLKAPAEAALAKLFPDIPFNG